VVGLLGVEVEGCVGLSGVCGVTTANRIHTHTHIAYTHTLTTANRCVPPTSSAPRRVRRVKRVSRVSGLVGLVSCKGLVGFS
jgi:hypothetical protein